MAPPKAAPISTVTRMCEGAETWAQRAADLAAEVVRLEDVIARCDEEIARLHAELIDGGESDV
jgi:hypothetical protein